MAIIQKKYLWASLLQRLKGGLIEMRCIEVSCCQAGEEFGFTPEHQKMPEMHLIVNILTSHDTAVTL